MDAAAVSASLQSISVRIDAAKTKLYETISGQYKEFVVGVSQGANLQEELDDLDNALTEISHDVEAPSGARAQFQAKSSELESIRTQMARSEVFVTMLKRLSEIHSALTAHQAALDSHDYEEAAKKLSAMDLQTLQTSGCDSRILNSLKEEIRNRRAQLKSRLLGDFERAVRFTSVDKENMEGDVKFKSATSMTIMRRIQGFHSDAAIDLQAILSSMEILGTLEQEIPHLAALICERLASPLLKNNCRIALDETKHEARFNVFVLTGSTSSEAVKGLGQLVELTRVVCEKLLGNNREMAATLGFALWPLLVDLVKTEIINSRQFGPKEYQELQQAIDQLERQSSSIGLIREQTSELSTFLQHIEAHNAECRRREQLNTARSILLSGDRSTVRVDQSTERGALANMTEGKGKRKNGDQKKEKMESEETYYELPPLRITVATQLLVEMAYQVMMEASNASTPQRAQDLYATVRDIFALFRAVVPTFHGDAIENDPQLCMLLHNDCTYIAHHMLTMGHEFEAKMPAIGVTVTFVDMVPSIRQMAESMYETHMRRQRTQLLESFGREKRFSNIASDELFTDAETAIKQTRHILSTVGYAWKDILARNLYFASIGVLVDVVFSAAIEAIKTQSEITEDETHNIHYLLTMLGQVDDLFVLEAKVKENRAAEKASPAQYVPSWAKFQELIEILGSDLSSIIDKSVRGALASWSKDELRNLVVTLYADTDYRRSKLQLLDGK